MQHLQRINAKTEILLRLLGVAALTLLLNACDVDQTQEGEAPDIDVSGDAGELPEYELVKTEEGEAPSMDVDYEAGEAPEYDVDTADVDVETKTVEMEVPTGVDVTMPDDEDDQ